MKGLEFMEYNYDENIVRKVIDTYLSNINNNVYKIMQEIDKDNKKGMLKVSIDNIREIIKKTSNEPFLLEKEKYDNRQIDGVGNIAVFYEGNPYITITLALKAIKNHCDIKFIPRNIYAVNGILIELFKHAIEKLEYYKDSVILLDNNQTNKLEEYSFDKIICIGNKSEYIRIKNLFDVPIIYNGYGNASIYVDNEYFKDILREIDEFVFENNINLEYYNNTNMETDIVKINQSGLNDITAIFTKDVKKAFNFIDKVKSKKIYVNKNPFDNYSFVFSDEELVLRKEVYTK